MSCSPYRISARPPVIAAADDAPPADDRELLPVFVIVWFASVARVVLGAWEGAGSATEVTFALLAVLGLPFLARDGLRAVVAQLRGGEPQS